MAETGRLEAIRASMVFHAGFRNRHSKTAVNAVSLAIGGAKPTITAIVGESGSGKTTLANLLLGFLHPTGGEIRYSGKNLTAMSRNEQMTFRREVQAIFQDPFEVFNPFYIVDHALMTPLKMFGLARGGDEARTLVENALTTVGLRPQDTLGRYPHQLSGGQRQRVMIARALLLKPRIILADEPVSMVDASLRSTILETLFKLRQEAGISLIYITHDITTAYQIADHVYVLYGGSVAEAGAAEEVISRPQHPYTKALIDAIPSPDPDVPWHLEEATEEKADEASIATVGCPYRPRCPHAMDVCAGEAPPLYRVEGHRAASCYLFRDGPTVSADELLSETP
ncbi:MAG: ABC transporter ATP-binding protein [Hyphomicrobiaceae bacterium]|nr:ABC transporter ATP-binding protein [Hyphomicrobiaceae bacterium]